MEKLSLSQPVGIWSRRIAIALVGMIVAAALCLAALLAYDGYRNAQYDKTVDEPLHLSIDDRVSLALFAELQPVIARESLRVSATRFRERDFALELWLDPHRGRAQGVGQIVIVNPQNQVSKRNFAIPAATLRSLFAEWDAQAANYRGSRSMWLDGDPLSFERRSGRKVQSGGGNNPCHYDRLGDLLAKRLGAYVPELNDLRISAKTWSDRQHLCHPSILGRMWHQLVTPTHP